MCSVVLCLSKKTVESMLSTQVSGPGTSTHFVLLYSWFTCLFSLGMQVSLLVYLLHWDKMRVVKELPKPKYISSEVSHSVS